MCGIAGLIWKGGTTSNIGMEMTSMLQALKHRGPDSTGFALYGKADKDDYVMRFKTAEQEDLRTGFYIHKQIKEREQTVKTRLREMGVRLKDQAAATEYSHRYVFGFAGDMTRLIDYIEDIEGVEVLSLGNALELIKDLGDSSTVSAQYDLAGFEGTHAIGHSRMATESDVDIRSAHPYWAYPFSDVSLVHNGQLTNYWSHRRDLERRGHRFMSNCDSELIAVYIADRMRQGDDLETAMNSSVKYLDGVFSYLVATRDQLGMAKDTMAAKPMVVYESDEFVGLASEEIAIRSIFPREIDTFDPYEGEVLVWQA